MTEALFRAGDAALEARPRTFLWWVIGACVMLVLAVQVDAFKRRRGG